MTRRHKTLEMLVERAERLGTATNVGWTVEFMREASGFQDTNGRELVEYTYLFKHWGTIVLIITQEKKSNGLAPSAGGCDRPYTAPYLYDYYGQSKSDADGLNAMCAYFGLPDRFSFRPVNGGFIKLEMEESK